MHFAHSTPTSEDGWEPLPRHLHEVAGLARQLGTKFGFGNAADLAGRLHDLGKYSAAFQHYLRGQRPRGVDHATAGAQEVVKLAAGMDGLIARLLAYAIAGHHGGMPNQLGPGSLDDRLKKPVEPLDPIWRSEVEFAATGLFPIAFK